mgnify:CR=1 FL=1
MSDYQTVFEYEASGTSLINLISLPFFLLIGISIIYYAKKIIKNYSLYRQIVLFFGYIFTGMATLFLIIALVKIPQIISNDRDFRKMIESKNYNIVEGETENFSPMPKGKNGNESFTVNGISFEYCDYIMRKGFNKTSINNGLITKNGQKVRISYYTLDNENLILKIEIKN